MSLRDLDIGGVRPFDVNSDPSSVGTEWKRWLRSFQLYADGKGLIIDPIRTTTKCRGELSFCIARDRMSKIVLMFWPTLGVRKITRRPKML